MADSARMRSPPGTAARKPAALPAAAVQGSTAARSGASRPAAASKASSAAVATGVKQAGSRPSGAAATGFAARSPSAVVIGAGRAGRPMTLSASRQTAAASAATPSAARPASKHSAPTAPVVVRAVSSSVAAVSASAALNSGRPASRAANAVKLSPGLHRNINSNVKKPTSTSATPSTAAVQAAAPHSVPVSHPAAASVRTPSLPPGQASTSSPPPPAFVLDPTSCLPAAVSGVASAVLQSADPAAVTVAVDSFSAIVDGPAATESNSVRQQHQHPSSVPNGEAAIAVSQGAADSQAAAAAAAAASHIILRSDSAVDPLPSTAVAASSAEQQPAAVVGTATSAAAAADAAVPAEQSVVARDSSAALRDSGGWTPARASIITVASSGLKLRAPSQQLPPPSIVIHEAAELPRAPDQTRQTTSGASQQQPPQARPQQQQQQQQQPQANDAHLAGRARSTSSKQSAPVAAPGRARAVSTSGAAGVWGPSAGGGATPAAAAAAGDGGRSTPQSRSRSASRSKATAAAAAPAAGIAPAAASLPTPLAVAGSSRSRSNSTSGTVAAAGGGGATGAADVAGRANGPRPRALSGSSRHTASLSVAAPSIKTPPLDPVGRLSPHVTGGVQQPSAGATAAGPAAAAPFSTTRPRAPSTGRRAANTAPATSAAAAAKQPQQQQQRSRSRSNSSAKSPPLPAPDSAAAAGPLSTKQLVAALESKLRAAESASSSSSSSSMGITHHRSLRTVPAAVAAAPPGSSSVAPAAAAVARPVSRVPGPAGRRAASSRQQLTATKAKLAEGSGVAGAGPRKSQAYLASQLGGFGLLASVAAASDGEAGGGGGRTLHSVPSTERLTARATLIHIKGRRRVKSRRVPLSWQSLNDGDSFVLDDAPKQRVYVWHGTHANRIESAKAVDLASRIKFKDHKGRAVVVNVEMYSQQNNGNAAAAASTTRSSGDQSAAHGLASGFWQTLAYKGQPLRTAEQGGDDDAFDALPAVQQFIEFSSGSQAPIAVDAVQQRSLPCDKLKRADLQSACAYILDCGDQVYCWKGSKASPAIKKTSIAAALSIVQHGGKGGKKRCAWVDDVDTIIEGAEPVLFQEQFLDWAALPINVAPLPRRVPSVRKLPDFRIDSLFPFPERPSDSLPAGDPASGELQRVWRIVDAEKVPLDVAEYGTFFSGESYVAQYRFTVGRRDEYTVWFWQGRNSSVNEKGTSAYQTVSVTDEIQARDGGSTTQKRVVQNKESKHFMSVFGGAIVIHRGKRNDRGPVPVRLYVEARNPTGLRIVEVEASSASLSSLFCFLLVRQDGRVTLWCGKSSGDLAATAAAHAQFYFKLSSSDYLDIIREEQEPESFFLELGGRAPFCQLVFSEPPRLLKCSIATGSFVAEPIFDYAQDDLDNSDCFCLCGGQRVFLWIGGAAAAAERKQSLEFAQQYIERCAATSGEMSLSLERAFVVEAGAEPVEFRGMVPGWDGSACTGCPPLDALQTLVFALFNYRRQYTLAELRSRPAVVEWPRAEQYLSDEEFLQTLGMTKHDFEGQSNWTKEKLKKHVGLF